MILKQSTPASIIASLRAREATRGKVRPSVEVRLALQNVLEVALSLADAYEELERGERPALALNSEDAIRDDLDNSRWFGMLAWADLIEERGDGATAEAMRWLASQKKWPGSIRGKFRWTADDTGTNYGKSSFTLPSHFFLGGQSDAVIEYPSESAALLATAQHIGKLSSDVLKATEVATD